MNDVPADTYTQIAVTFSSATIGYLQTGSGAPTIATMPATFTTPTYTPRPSPIRWSSQPAGPVGLRMDFRLDKSIQVSNGQITGDVTPTLDITAVGPSDPGAYIDEFIAGVVNPTALRAVLLHSGTARPHLYRQRQRPTEWDNGESLATSPPPASSRFPGSSTAPTPPSTPTKSPSSRRTASTPPVRSPTSSLPPASPATSSSTSAAPCPPAVTASPTARLPRSTSAAQRNSSSTGCTTRSPQFLFNPSTLLPGQHVSVGGTLAGAANGEALSVKRIVLRNWGFNGTLVANSVNTGNGTFQMNINGFAGLLVPGQPVTVYVGARHQIPRRL